MRKVILFIAASMDSYIAGENDEIDWLFMDGDYGYKKFMEGIDTTLMGNGTYKVLLDMGEKPYPGLTNYVFTRNRDNKNADGIIYVYGEIEEKVREIIRGEGKDIMLVGGGQINTILLNAGLIDEIVLSLHPVFLGKGKPLFGPGAELTWFDTGRVETFESGLVQIFLHKRQEN